LQFFNRRFLSVKIMVMVLFMIVWVFQAREAISNKDRLNKAIESAQDAILQTDRSSP
jgi:hypothetical protein